MLRPDSTCAGSPQWPYGNYFHNITGLNDYDNYLNTNAPADFGYYAPYLNQPAVRTALHVGNATFPSAPSVCERHLLADFMVSLKDEVCMPRLLLKPRSRTPVPLPRHSRAIPAPLARHSRALPSHRVSGTERRARPSPHS